MTDILVAFSNENSNDLTNNYIGNCKPIIFNSPRKPRRVGEYFIRSDIPFPNCSFERRDRGNACYDVTVVAREMDHPEWPTEPAQQLAWFRRMVRTARTLLRELVAEKSHDVDHKAAVRHLRRVVKHYGELVGA